MLFKKFGNLFYSNVAGRPVKLDFYFMIKAFNFD